jgi:hypothetical protein
MDDAIGGGTVFLAESSTLSKGVHCTCLAVVMRTKKKNVKLDEAKKKRKK